MSISTGDTLGKLVQNKLDDTIITLTFYNILHAVVNKENYFS